MSPGDAPREILLWLQQEDGDVTPASWGLSRFAARLAAHSGARVVGVLIGEQPEAPPELAHATGLDELVLVAGAGLDLYEQRRYVAALGGVWAEAPGLFLTVSTPDGRDLALALALEQDLPCVTAALVLTPDGSDLVAAQPVPMGLYAQQTRLRGGRACVALVEEALEHGLAKEASAGPAGPAPWDGFAPTDLAVPPTSAVAPQRVADGGRSGVAPGERQQAPQTRRVTADAVEPVWSAEQILPADPETVDVAEADFVVCAGAGVGSEEVYAKLAGVALALGAAVGVTRPVVDEGWAPFERQIGQTGRYLSGRAYVGFGVSGAVHHTAGIADCDLVISVNTDPAAPIFQVSDLGFVADADAVLSALAEQVEAELAQASGDAEPPPDDGPDDGGAGDPEEAARS